MTTLMTSCTWGSRAMALSSIFISAPRPAGPQPRGGLPRALLCGGAGRQNTAARRPGSHSPRALGQGGRVDQALVGEQQLEGVQPALVVARGLALALGVGDLGDQLGLELAPLARAVVVYSPGHT